MSTIRSPPNKHSSRSARRQYHRIPTEDGTYPIQPQFNVPVTTSRPKPKQPNRTTKTSQKLTLFPEDIALSQPSQVLPEELLIPEAEDLYGQLTQVPPERIGKLDRKKLPRVTAYCTANAYRLDDLMTFLKSLPNLITQPKKLDECVYIAIPSKAGQSLPVPRYPNFSDSFSNSYTKPDPTSGGEETKLSIPNSPPLFPDRMGTASADGPSRSESAQLSDDLNTSHGQISINQSHDSIPPVPSRDSQRDLESNIRPQRAPESENFRNNVGEVFYFDYGVVVMWGLTEDEESRVLKQVRGFEEESLEKDDIETEAFVFHYNANYQPRIYNDIITLKSPSNYMAKLTISHAIAQSTKLTLFEGLIEETIEKTKNVPECMAKTGKVELSRSAITKKIGQLFIMRINVNLVSNVLDTPEIFWSEPALEPLYQAIRGYLEISQRVELVNQRVAVISDLLDMLKEHLTSSHGEQLEWIVIILIAFEIIIGIITICFDYFSYLRETKDGGS